MRNKLISIFMLLFLSQLRTYPHFWSWFWTFWSWFWTFWSWFWTFWSCLRDCLCFHRRQRESLNSISVPVY